MITAFSGEDRQPILSEDEKSIYYLSEESGTFNVHKLSLENPSESEQLTNFCVHPVRNMPGVIDNGRDQQLERAVEEMLRDVN